MPGSRRSALVLGVGLVGLSVLAILFNGGSEKESASTQAGPRQPGIGLVVLVDTSGSMRERVPGSDGRATQKILIARSTVHAVIRRLEEFSKANPERPVQLAVYEFSDRNGKDLCRPVVAMGKPDAAASRAAVEEMGPDGGTPIGEAMAVANRELDRAGFASSHLIVVTDGENTVGRAPGDVARELAALPLEQRPALYFVAFDVAAAKFSAVKEAGGMLLSASNEPQLKEALEYLLGEKILVEKPSGTK